MQANIIKILGSDRDVVMASRVATSRTDKPLGEEQVRSSIKYLIKNRHWSPFEFAQIWIRVEAPIYVARQWFRHSGAFMEKSRRYTADEVETEKYELGNEIFEEAKIKYKEILTEDKPENARKVLPMATYTTFLWNTNLRDFLHFIRLRLDPHAQPEIRQLADDLLYQITPHFPVTVENFSLYELGEFSFSLDELRLICDILKESDDESKTKEKILKNAESRISMVEGVFTRFDARVSDSSSTSQETSVPPSDSPEVPEEV